MHAPARARAAPAAAPGSVSGSVQLQPAACCSVAAGHCPGALAVRVMAGGGSSDSSSGGGGGGSSSDSSSEDGARSHTVVAYSGG